MDEAEDPAPQQLHPSLTVEPSLRRNPTSQDMHKDSHCTYQSSCAFVRLSLNPTVLPEELFNSIVDMPFNLDESWEAPFNTGPTIPTSKAQKQSSMSSILSFLYIDVHRPMYTCVASVNMHPQPAPSMFSSLLLYVKIQSSAYHTLRFFPSPDVGKKHPVSPPSTSLGPFIYVDKISAC